MRGERVKAVGDEVHRIYNRLTNEADIYLIDDGYVAVNNRSATGRPDLRLLERVLDGLQAL